MRVSVVVPTVGRPELRRALDSALAQQLRPCEVLVVNDGAGEVSGLVPDDAHCPITVLCPARGRGAPAARNTGIDHATGDLIALLDDDDWWRPDKLVRQVRLYERLQAQSQVPLVVSCRATDVSPSGKVCATVSPRLVMPCESVAALLFERRRIRPTDLRAASSTLVASRELFRAVPFDQSLSRHQDWDWLLRAERLRGAVLAVHPERLVTYTRQAPGRSVSSGGTWQTSLDWVTANAAYLTSRQQADFILCVAAAHAAHAGAWNALPVLARRAAELGASWRAWLAITADCTLTAGRAAVPRQRPASPRS